VTTRTFAVRPSGRTANAAALGLIIALTMLGKRSAARGCARDGEVRGNPIRTPPNVECLDLNWT